MRKISFIALSATLSAALCSCAGMAGGPGPVAREMAQLRADCEARGGILVPSGVQTGRPALDDVCEIRDPTRISP